jgi:hypothetical protein
LAGKQKSGNSAEQSFNHKSLDTSEAAAQDWDLAER